jgi:threonine synthase
VIAGAALTCPVCGPVPGDDPAPWRCGRCASPLELPAAQIDPSAPLSGDGLWRYLPWLPVDVPVALGEPTTPLSTTRWPGPSGPLEIHWKLEASLPTGSFKDRGAAVAVAWLRDRGVLHVIEDSSGNAGAALAGYAARAGIACTVFVPTAASPAKLAQIETYGAVVVRVAGARTDVTEAAVGAASGPGVTYASHLWNPAFLAGTRTFAFEAWEQLGRRAPDAVVFPVGAGTLLLGAHRGFRDLLDAGLIERVPRIIGVQSAACAPLAAAVDAGSTVPVPIRRAASGMAEGILLADPPRGRAILDAVRSTGGTIVAVDDGLLVDALRRLGRLGLFVEPTSAVAAAGLARLAERGFVGPGQTVVCALTGSGLKAADRIAALGATAPGEAAPGVTMRGPREAAPGMDDAEPPGIEVE